MQTLTKANSFRARTEHFILRDAVSRSRQKQLSGLLQGLNDYFHKKIQKRNVTIEVSTALQLYDLFEPIYGLKEVTAGGYLKGSADIVHSEGQILAIYFLDPDGLKDFQPCEASVGTKQYCILVQNETLTPEQLSQM